MKLFSEKIKFATVLFIIFILFFIVLSLKSNNFNKAEKNISNFTNSSSMSCIRTDLTEKEIEILVFARKEAIKIFTEEFIKDNFCFKIVIENYSIPIYFEKSKNPVLKAWHVSGKMLCRDNDDCQSESIEIYVSDEKLEVLNISHSR